MKHQKRPGSPPDRGAHPRARCEGPGNSPLRSPTRLPEASSQRDAPAPGPCRAGSGAPAAGPRRPPVPAAPLTAGPAPPAILPAPAPRPPLPASWLPAPGAGPGRAAAVPRGRLRSGQCRGLRSPAAELGPRRSARCPPGWRPCGGTAAGVGHGEAWGQWDRVRYGLDDLGGSFPT